MRDGFTRGEIPYASHGLYTQPGVLDDLNPEKLGIEAGFAFRKFAAKTVVYQDLGISRGMEQGISHANELGQPVEFRSIAGADIRSPGWGALHPVRRIGHPSGVWGRLERGGRRVSRASRARGA